VAQQRDPWEKWPEPWEKWRIWERSLKRDEVPFTEHLLPGAWTKIELILTPAKPEDLGYIELELKTDQVTLNSFTERQ
jgi:hypothetical protein